MTESDDGQRFIVNLFSFGFKYGTPEDATSILDVRFLPNPYWVEDMRHLDGRNPAVAEYVLNNDAGQGLIDIVLKTIAFLVEQNRNAGKAEMLLGIGCTGGHHRSVAVVEQLALLLQKESLLLNVTHRDLARE